MGDLISREEVLENAFKIYTYECGLLEVVGVATIETLPSVKPQEPQTGKWIERRNRATGHIESVCSVCGAEEGYPYNIYCGNCGAKMESEVCYETDN